MSNGRLAVWVEGLDQDPELLVLDEATAVLV